MRLKALDQISISAVKADSLRPGEPFNINDAAGKDLLERHPTIFERLDAGEAEKAEPAPLNKMATPPLNKSTARKRAKAD
ncbi:hypothetical protein [Azorhizobium sp. AG788]|uniref:hypothetical protein n=1 Tax=Azorhizobium sp. AG788 TaxID=2183897 RepID=UPI00313A01D0